MVKFIGSYIASKVLYTCMPEYPGYRERSIVVVGV